VVQVPVFNTLLGLVDGDKGAEGTDVFMAQEDGTKFSKQGTGKGFCKIIGEHFSGGTMGDDEIVAPGMVGNKEIADIDVA
jgi:hypothetical protein